MIKMKNFGLLGWIFSVGVLLLLVSEVFCDFTDGLTYETEDAIIVEAANLRQPRSTPIEPLTNDLLATDDELLSRDKRHVVDEPSLEEEHVDRLIRQKRQFGGWPGVLPIGPCFTSKGIFGHCTSFRKCYPYFKLPELSNWETWILGMYDTCSYFTTSGRQIVMMGNENSSHLSGLEIDNKAIEVSDSWTLHSATVNSGITPRPTLSIFISGLLQGGESTLPLELTAKNLMLHRHPYVLKYVSSWKKNGKHHLATEEVIPLSHVLNKLTPLQICIGLHSILKALIFLHEKALSSHNNVCCAAIYVTPDGTWKLGGLEYLCPFMKLTVKHLQQMKGRYEKAIPPEAGAGKTTPAAIDTFGFGVLVEEVLRGQVGDCVPALAEFREVCRINLQNHSPAERPPLTNLLSHQFLTHDFITIHNFLLELPLKTETEKQTFFRSLSDDLSHFPEELVASQLGGLLLSRLVLLDQTAQQYIFPQVITPKNDEVSFGLFSVETYRLHLVPRLLQMMCVRDAQIRLLLLTHFSVLCRAFTTDQLRTHVLPELLVGIKDTNDHLVSVTLHALADLVPMLGAATVIGGKRGKLFTDGRPKAHCTSVRKSPLRIPSINKHAVSSEPNLRSFANNLPERPSPDGGEDQLPTTDEETEAWSDWDENHASHVDNTFTNVEPNTSVEEELGNNDEIVEVSEINVLEIKTSSRNSLPDISTLDIKHSTSTSSKNKDEIDFFEDMVPVISKTLFTHISEQDELKPVNGAASKGRFDITTEDDADGWGDDLDDWGEVSEPISATATTS